ncbi:alpha/beta hydrolase [Pseudonocardia sp. N23]|uniref:PHA/PHB synthase family protein n=1 Tax=Pseudonocardia sp. N23 TaxID=1987376 RepID=UPI000BFC1E30|nr:alpha/beta fold hydrolase [Pseudonocardia sp. N23]GAY10486.1 polyhydroxyalkanoic acid synthase [Pseudonocardia sp. N23]
MGTSDVVPPPHAEPSAGSAARTATARSAVSRLRDVVSPSWLAARLDPIDVVGTLAGAALAVAGSPSAAVAATTRLAGGSLHALAAVTGSGDAPAPPPDRRHSHPAWETNAWYAFLRREHVLLAEWAHAVAAGTELGPGASRKLAFVLDQAVAAADPANWPLTNPEVPAAALRTGGRSILRGLRNLVRDVATNGAAPRQVPRDALLVGRDIAATPGKVVFRNDLVELVQYAPTTATVHRTPLLLSPPWINKYYVMDLAPGRSFAQWAVDHGRTVFALSYRNPDAAHRDLTMSDYLRDGLLAALDVVEDVTGESRADVAALCLGGTLATAAAAWLAARGDRRIGTLTLLNTMLDYRDPGPLGVFTDARSVARLERRMRGPGFLPASAMKATFDSLRPEDLVWRYVVEGWWLGEDPPVFDLLVWNADSTRMPAAMQTEYLAGLYVENRLATGRMELAGELLDLGAVRQDTYVVAAETDHIAPWRSVHAGARHLGGDVRFVLTTSGHIAGVVNPPSPRAAHRIGTGPLPADADTWRDAAERRSGSWWEDWAVWAGERAGPMRPPPPTGSSDHPPLDDAPGRYVRET